MHVSRYDMSRSLFGVIKYFFSSGTFGQKCVILKGLLGQEKLKQDMVFNKMGEKIHCHNFLQSQLIEQYQSNIFKGRKL